MWCYVCILCYVLVFWLLVQFDLLESISKYEFDITDLSVFPLTPFVQRKKNLLVSFSLCVCVFVCMHVVNTLIIRKKKNDHYSYFKRKNKKKITFFPSTDIEKKT